ncbi:GNAT family N-acetyltransferase [Vibrio sp. S11_S32]|nr:GNAT family N-acetyltransferase [Vibrio sp. S11_S32]
MCDGATFQASNFCLRLLKSNDAKLMCQFYAQNKPHLQPWEPIRDDVYYSESGWAKRIETLNIAHQHKLSFSFIILDKEQLQVYGVINYTNLSGYPFYACNLGYALAENAQGQGLMQTALTLTNQWMFDCINKHRIMAAYIPDNIRSERVLKNLGFIHEGTAKDYLLIDGDWQTHHLMSLTNHHWQAPEMTTK